MQTTTHLDPTSGDLIITIRVGQDELVDRPIDGLAASTQALIQAHVQCAARRKERNAAA